MFRSALLWNQVRTAYPQRTSTTTTSLLGTSAAGFHRGSAFLVKGRTVGEVILPRQNVPFLVEGLFVNVPQKLLDKFPFFGIWFVLSIRNGLVQQLQVCWVLALLDSIEALRFSRTDEPLMCLSP